MTKNPPQIFGRKRPVYSAHVAKGVQLNVWPNEGKNGEFVSAQIVHEYEDATGQKRIEKCNLPSEALASLSIYSADAHKAAQQERYEQYKRTQGQSD